MVRDANREFQGMAPGHALGAGAPRQLPMAPRPDAPETFRQKLLEAAAARQGRLSVTEGVLATGKTFDEVETALDEMAKSGYVGIDNHPDTGVVVYTFGQLMRD
jgi:hypothetical protein